MKFLRYVILLSCCGCMGIYGKCQSNNHAHHINGWYMYIGDHLFSKKWGIHLEAQWRRSDWITTPQQLLLRTGINYHFNNKTFVTAGYAFIQTYPYGFFPVAVDFPEHRIWQQLQSKPCSGKLEWVYRLRLEQRFSHVPVVNSSGEYSTTRAVYTNRFRMFNRLSMAFNGNPIQDKSLYLSFYHEIFIGFGKNIPNSLFDQNRLYLALGYKIPKAGRLEIGYLHQFILKSDGIRAEHNHTLQVGFSSTIDFFKTPEEPKP